MWTNTDLQSDRFWTLRFLFHPGGVVGRLPFFVAGIGLFGAKYALDYLLATVGFRQPWSLAYYLPGTQSGLAVSAPTQAVPLYITVLVFSLPFIWTGVCLTAKRLREAGMPVWLTVLFFVPMINLVFFAALCAIPPTGVQCDDSEPPMRVTFPGGSTENQPRYSVWFSLCLTAVLGTFLAALDVYKFGVYGFGLFVGLPFVLGMVASLLVGMRGARSPGSCIAVSLGSALVTPVLLLLLGMEGAICLLMAAPLWLGCAALGGFVGFHVQQQTRTQREAILLILVIALVAPVIMGGERLLPVEAETFEVRTAITIDANPDRVWNNVISFPDLDVPQEWLFRLGVAYPTGATIDGSGVGAERRCRFSTGDFVEPIEVWDSPRLLRFSVTTNPPPMRELSIYDDVHPPHLDGFLQSRQGEFRLTSLANGQTLLEGTTWYQHHMQPAAYWKLWSDEIIHAIHLRVLRHIAELCQNGREGTAVAMDDLLIGEPNDER